MKHISEVANEYNKFVTEELKYIPIEYDGLVCPKCYSSTVHSGPFIWCPNIRCNFGNEIKQLKLITKWAIR